MKFIKQDAQKFILGAAAIAFMVVVLIISRNFDESTRKFGIVFFGSVICVLLAALGMDIAAEVQALQLEKWKAKRAARIHHYYEIDRDSFNTVAKKALADDTMRAFIKEIDANGKQYCVEVRYIDEKEGESK